MLMAAGGEGGAGGAGGTGMPATASLAASMESWAASMAALVASLMALACSRWARARSRDISRWASRLSGDTVTRGFGPTFFSVLVWRMFSGKFVRMEPLWVRIARLALVLEGRRRSISPFMVTRDT